MTVTATEAIALRDGTGAWYLLTPALLGEARLTAEQHGEIVRQFSGRCDLYAARRSQGSRERFQVMSVVLIPAPPPARRGNPFWPGIVE
jgi:hypothetical protein